MTRSSSKAVKATPAPKGKGTGLSEEQFQAISRAVSDPRRFAILRQIASSSAALPCGALQEHAVISPATVSHHLKELVDAGLVASERDGRCAHLTLERAVWKAYLKRLSEL